jgi:hypothetical protein
MGGRWSWERMAAGSGIVFVALFVAGFFSTTKPPSLNASNAKWVSFVTGHTKELKISSILFGLAVIAFLWFAGSIAKRMRDGGEARLASVLMAATAASVAIAGILIACQAALVRIAADNPSQVKGFVDLMQVAGVIFNFPGCVVIGTVAIAAMRSGILPMWYGQLSGVAAIAVLFSGGALAQKGFYSPDGGYAIISTIVFAAWALVTSGLMLMDAERAPRTAAAPA